MTRAFFNRIAFGLMAGYLLIDRFIVPFPDWLAILVLVVCVASLIYGWLIVKY